jgi:hypothetical protein
MEYNVKSSYYYNLDGKVAIQDKYVITITSSTQMTADQLKTALKSELLPSPRLAITEEKLTSDDKEISGATLVNPKIDLSYKVVQVGPGTIDDPKKPK